METADEKLQRLIQEVQSLTSEDKLALFYKLGDLDTDNDGQFILYTGLIEDRTE
jgi:hypothetical protein